MPPDPAKSLEPDEVTPPDHPEIVMSESSEENSDEEEMENGGYELLPDSETRITTEPNQEDDLDESDSSRVLQHIRTHLMPNTLPESEPEAVNESEPSETFSLSKDDSEKIKSVMSNIKLPASSIPDWAQVVPEHNWKSLLDQKIRDKGMRSEK